MTLSKPIVFCFTFIICGLYQSMAQIAQNPRIIISTDIGGTDPDDFQSMMHLLMYADLFEIEGLISSPFGQGRKQDILNMISLYEEDYDKLKKHASTFPSADSLRDISKQGAIQSAPYQGFSSPTEGSEWIIQCARQSNRKLWVLVWGGLEDLAQALHDAPDIKKKLRVYWIGGPNKKWSVNAYTYIAEHHADLWMIEANATYRGWFMYRDTKEDLKQDRFYDAYIRTKGAMGSAFEEYYEGDIKMGDTPSLAYLIHGKPEEPGGQSWGGTFEKIEFSARSSFEGNSSLEDTVSTYAILEWKFRGPKLDIHADSACFQMEIWGQSWPGYYLGDGWYGIRYSPKRAETGYYQIHSEIEELDGLEGAYVSVDPWPGKRKPSYVPLGQNWYSDISDPKYFIEGQQGAQTVAQFREDFLKDWAKRWKWLE